MKMTELLADVLKENGARVFSSDRWNKTNEKNESQANIKICCIHCTIDVYSHAFGF